jgi:hypothetical protein
VMAKAHIAKQMARWAEKKKKKKIGKNADLRIPLNWTVIRDNDVSGRWFEEWTSIRDWTSIWVYHIYVHCIAN